MSLLRKELKKNKEQKEKIVNEAALQWLSKNVIVINEKLDRKSVTRLINSIQKFDDTFGEYKDKIPSIGSHLDAAEQGLQMIITGKLKSTKVSDNLKQLSYLYSTLSNFFTRDLPILLKIKMFRAAKENPDQPINSLPAVAQDGTKLDIKTIHDALANSMRPSKDEKKLLSKIYRGSKMPKLQISKIVNELLALTYSELEQLTEVGKVPMATTPPDAGDEEGSDEASNLELSPEETGPEQEKQNPLPATGEAVQHDGEVLQEHVILENILAEATAAELGNALQSAYQAVRLAGITSLQRPLNDLHSKVIKYLSSTTGEKAKEFLSQAKDKKTGLLDLFKTPGGNLLKQANMTVETLKTLGRIWPKVKNLMNKPNPTEEDLENIKKVLVQQINGGVLKRLGSMFRTAPYPGLDPESIVNAITMGESKAWRKIELLEQRILEEQVDEFGKTQLNPLAPGKPVPDQPIPPTQETPKVDAKTATKVEPAVDVGKKMDKLKRTLMTLQKFSNGSLAQDQASGPQSNPNTDTPQETLGKLDAAAGDTNVQDTTSPPSAENIPATQTTPEVQSPQAQTIGLSEPQQANTTEEQSSTAKSVDYPDIEKKSKELGMSPGQLEKAIKWVGVNINK